MYRVEDLFNLVTLQVLLVILATLVGPKHSVHPMVCHYVRASRKCLNKIFHVTFTGAPSYKPTEGDHVIDQIEQIVCFSCFLFVFNCDIKVLNGNYVNNHVTD